MAYTSRRYEPYQPGQTEPFKVSRWKIELFKQCPRCFWLDARLKIKRPSGPPFNINKTIDELYKKEFDRHREAGTPHPIMADNQIKAVPYQHEDLDTWRYNFTGVNTCTKPTNLHVFGAIDDVWVNDDGELIVVDYKATSKTKRSASTATGRSATNASWKSTSGCCAKTALRSATPAISCTPTPGWMSTGFDDNSEFTDQTYPIHRQ